MSAQLELGAASPPRTPAPEGATEHTLGWHLPDLRNFELRLAISGRPFVLKNSKQIITLPGRRPILVPSRQAKSYLKLATVQLRACWSEEFYEPLPVHVLVNAAIVSYRATLHRNDASNLYQAPEDAMQAAGVLTDDFQIGSHDGSRRRYDKNNPRVEITLTPYVEESWLNNGGLYRERTAATKCPAKGVCALTAASRTSPIISRGS